MQFECIFSWGFAGVNPLRHRCAMPPPPKGGGFALLTGRWQKAPPSGELDATNGSGLRGFVLRRAAAPGCDPTRENSVWSGPQAATNAK